MHVKYFTKTNSTFAFILSMVFFLLACEGNKEEVALEVLNGNLVFEVDSHMRTKLSSKLEDSKKLMDGFQESEQLILSNGEVSEFEVNGISENKLEGDLKGNQWVVTGTNASDDRPIKKILTITKYDDFPDLISTKVKYVNESEKNILIDRWVNNQYHIKSQQDSPPFWAFQGSSSSSRSDWIKPLEPGYYQKNFMGMNASDYGGGIPVTCVWRPDISLAVGHLSLVPKRINLPTEFPENSQSSTIGISKDFEDHTFFKSKDSISTLETFVSISKGDYYENLTRYSLLMQAKGIEMVEPEEAAFEPIWCAWGYERNFTLNEIKNTLPKVKELGIKWAVLDDGFQIAEGDWDANPKKFKHGNKDIKNLVDKIHDYGLKAKIWWTPLAADPGSEALKKHPDMRITQEDGSPQFITWWDAYYLSPTKKETIEHTQKILDLFLNQWNFDGLKMDGQHMNAVAPDYSLENPEESVEGLPDFFKMIYEEAREIKPHAVVENCPCGTCMSFYNMASMNQAVSSDPLSSWQIRTKGKTYKALVPNTAYYGDHVELSDNAEDFATSFGIGAVLGTKFTWPKDNPQASDSFLLTPEKEKKWKKWFSLYNDMMLSKEQYLGNLYDIGYDKPEAHVIKKKDTLYYAFYAKDWDGKITFKGLKDNAEYVLRDYVNDRNLGTINSSNPEINLAFKDYLLISASPK